MKAKIGDRVIITHDCGDCYFSNGDEAIITSVDDDGDFWADFTVNGTYKQPAGWCIGHNQPDTYRFEVL